MVCPIYEVARDGTCPLLLQPGFQPRTGANPYLDSGCPTRIFKPDETKQYANDKIRMVQIHQTKSKGHPRGAPIN